MEKCKVCNKSLKGAVKSAKREDGSYYIICPSCGNVMRVEVSEGLTTICRTPEGYSDVVQEMMEEAYELFEEVGIRITQYIAKINEEKRSAEELRKPEPEVEEEDCYSDSSELSEALKNDEIKYMIVSTNGVGYAIDKEDLQNCLNSLSGELINVYELNKKSVKEEKSYTID